MSGFVSFRKRWDAFTFSLVAVDFFSSNYDYFIFTNYF